MFRDKEYNTLPMIILTFNALLLTHFGLIFEATSYKLIFHGDFHDRRNAIYLYTSINKGGEEEEAMLIQIPY